MSTLMRSEGGALSSASSIATSTASSLWLCTQPLDMRSDAERLLAHVVQWLGGARSHHGYLFANVRATRIKLLMHDGFGIRCAARRLNSGFVWPRDGVATSAPPALTQAQFDALVFGPPWQRLAEHAVITRV